MTPKQEKLIENYVRTKVRSMLKEEYDPKNDVKKIQFHCLELMKDKIDYSLFMTNVSAILDYMRKQKRPDSYNPN